MRIAFLYMGGRLQRMEKIIYGQAMDDFLYGSIELRAKGHTVGLFELSNDSRHPIIRKLGDILHNQCLLPPKTSGLLLEQIKDVIPQFSDYEVVVVAGSPLAFGLSLWKKLGLLKIPVVAIHCGLFNHYYGTFQRYITNYLLRHMWTILFGEGEYKPLCEFMGKGIERVFVNQCGTDINFWTPNGQEEKYIFSIGNDNHRDYDLLVEAAAELNVPFKLVTKVRLNSPIPPNVEIITGDMVQEILTDKEVRELYRNAICVVVPLRDSLQPSGQSVCLQAMSCGKPVILTHTTGLWSETIMQDGENVLFVPPGNREALIKKIKFLLDHPNKRGAIGKRALETVHLEFNMRDYADRLEKVCQMAINAQ